MYWVIQENTYNEAGMNELIETLERADIPHSLHKVVPFVGDIVPDVNPDDNVIVMGSYSLRHIAKRKGWVPGSFDLGDLTYQDHIDWWGTHMLNWDSIFCSFKEAMDHINYNYINDDFFIRPVVDSKNFAGTVMNKEEFSEWWEKVVVLEEDDGSNLRGSTEIMISPIMNILREYRNWVVDGKVITSSLYKIGNKVQYSDVVDDDIINFAQDMVDSWQPNRAFVIDIALLENGEKKIVETNTFNAAGLYAANIGKLVDAIERMEF